ncbi:MAG: carbohydrate kinase [Magnetococcales bacterium]|nr:carbohydrate kinase [Magnetococcales bacterium]
MYEEGEIESVGRPVLFGEVLFDQFPDGAAIIGGAPFNVAYHLRGFGLNPLMISRIGRDSLGESVIQTMSRWGMDVSGIQIDDTHPTGRVSVKMVENNHSFTILPKQAYDHIAWEPVVPLLEQEHNFLFYHGTLAARTEGSRQALLSILNQWSPLTLVDLNLRAPWWNGPLVREALTGARWIKLNDSELTDISGLSTVSETGLEREAVRLQKNTGAELIAVTRGEEGAFFYGGGELMSVEGIDVTIADTVGAGDAFSAVLVLGITFGWDMPTTLQRAIHFAAAICTIRGAVPASRTMYSEFIAQWKSS